MQFFISKWLDTQQITLPSSKDLYYVHKNLPRTLLDGTSDESKPHSHTLLKLGTPVQVIIYLTTITRSLPVGS
jgi:hypothetical protein